MAFDRDDIQLTGVDSNGDKKTFNIISVRIEEKMQKSLIVKFAIGFLDRFLSTVPKPEMQDITIEAEIKGIEPGDYPNSSSYSNHNQGYKEELERHFYKFNPSPDLNPKLTEFKWHGQTYSGAVTDITFIEETNEDLSQRYEATIEFSVFDVLNAS